METTDMGKYICIDTSVLIKLFFEEEDSFKAKKLMLQVIENDQIIVLPAFAWAEIGSVFRKKSRNKQISLQDAEEMWASFREFPGMEYVEGDSIAERAWNISLNFDLPTLYDAAFLAVAEEIGSKMDTCEFWTADERLINSLGEEKAFVKFLKSM